MKSFTLHRLATDEAARRAIIDVACEKPQGEIADLERTLATYEAKYKMTSADALAAIARGELRPTREIEGWMALLRVRDHLIKAL